MEMQAHKEVDKKGRICQVSGTYYLVFVDWETADHVRVRDVFPNHDNPTMMPLKNKTDHYLSFLHKKEDRLTEADLSHLIGVETMLHMDGENHVMDIEPLH